MIDVEKPSIKKDTQVLVKITAAGICGSDIHIFHGTHAYATYPRIIGHEGCGIVEEVGSAVTDLKRVILLSSSRLQDAELAMPADMDVTTAVRISR